MKKVLFFIISLLMTTVLYGEGLLPLTLDSDKELYFYIQPEEENESFPDLGEYETHYVIKNIYIDNNANFSLTFRVIAKDINDEKSGSIPNCILAIYNEEKICIGAFVLDGFTDPLSKIDNYQILKISNQELMLEYDDIIDTTFLFYYPFMTSGWKELIPKYFSVMFIGSGAG